MFQTKKSYTDSRHIKIGRLGENCATTFLRKNGFRILERNFKCYAGELDIIAAKGRHLAVFEVKTRNALNIEHFPAINAIDKSKLSKLRTLSRIYINSRRVRLVRARLVRYSIEALAVTYLQDFNSKKIAFHIEQKRIVDLDYI
ncbi:MAG: YraN family protein, partial [Bdellovibrionales bacterium]|nr:YraN family protein [Bdellovibrionales bacterium]